MYSTLAKLLILLTLVQLCSPNRSADGHSDASVDIHARAKRWLTFIPNGGYAKLVAGFVLPTRWAHNLTHLLNCAYNIQAIYQIPASIIWPYPTSYFKERLDAGDYVDNSRGQLYWLLERMLSNLGGNGRDCLLRTICEVAETPLGHNGMAGEIFDAVFIPNDGDKIDEVYHQAKLNGLSGTDCVETYRNCPFGSGLLERISLVHYT